jgi:hypothetical protein
MKQSSRTYVPMLNFFFNYLPSKQIWHILHSRNDISPPPPRGCVHPRLITTRLDIPSHKLRTGVLTWLHLELQKLLLESKHYGRYTG